MKCQNENTQLTKVVPEINANPEYNKLLIETLKE